MFSWSSNSRAFGWLLLAAGVAVALAFVVADTAPSTAEWSGWLRANPARGVTVYFLVFQLASICGLPGFPLVLAAGFAFGLVGGFLLAFGSASVAAAISFCLGRSLARPFVVRYFAGRAWWTLFSRVSEKYGFRLTLLLRLSPVVPFSLLNYGMALSRISFLDFFLASTLGKAPSVAAYVYAAGAAARLVNGANQPTTRVTEALYWLGLAATIASVWLLSAYARRESSRLMAEPAPCPIPSGGRRISGAAASDTLTPGNPPRS